MYNRYKFGPKHSQSFLTSSRSLPNIVGKLDSSNIPNACARCSKKAPILFDSFRKKIHFCASCQNYFQRLCIIQGIKHRNELSFYSEAIYLEYQNVYLFYFSPTKHLVVQPSPSLIPLRDLPIRSSPRMKLFWTKLLFFEEVYAIEWTSQHILDQIKIENTNMKKRLF
jgi:hypothetical protein